MNDGESGGRRAQLAAGLHDGSVPAAEELTRRSRFARLADRARARGVSGVDAGGVLPAEPTVARCILEDRGLRLAASWYGLRLLARSVDAELSRMEGHLNLVAGLGADVLVAAEVTGSVHADGVSWRRRPALHPGARRRLFRGLNVIAEHLEDRGIRLAYHHHLGTVVETAAEVEDLLEQTSDAVGLSLDLGQAAAAGAEVRAWLTRHPARVAHVYARDIRPGVLEVSNLKQASFAEAVEDGLFEAVGTGLSEARSALEHLRQKGYSGWVVLGALPGRADAAQFARVRSILLGKSEAD